MAASPVAGGVSQTNTLNGTAVVRGEFLALAGHAEFGVAKLGGQALGALTDLNAKATAINGFFSQKGQRLCRTKFGFNAHLLFGQHAHLVHFHHCAHGGAKADGVNAFFVAEHGGVLQGFQVFHTIGRAQRPSRFVFQTTRGAPVLRLVGHGEVTLVHLADATAGNRATKTGLVSDELLFAVGLARGGHGFGRDVFGALKLVVAVVAGGQGAHLVDDVHQHLRAVGGQTLAGDGVFGQNFFLFGNRLHEGFGVVDIAHALGAAHCNGFQIFTAHDGAYA